jgi:hypothetical protein
MQHAWETRNVYKILVGKPGPRQRLEDNVRMDLREVGVGKCGLDSSGSEWTLVIMIMNLWVP